MRSGPLPGPDLTFSDNLIPCAGVIAQRERSELRSAPLQGRAADHPVPEVDLRVLPSIPD